MIFVINQIANNAEFTFIEKISEKKNLLLKKSYLLNDTCINTDPYSNIFFRLVHILDCILNEFFLVLIQSFFSLSCIGTYCLHQI